MRGMLKLEGFWLGLAALALLEGIAALGIFFYLSLAALQLGQQFTSEVGRLTEVARQLTEDTGRFAEVASKFEAHGARFNDLASQLAFDFKRTNDNISLFIGAASGPRIPIAPDSSGSITKPPIKAFLKNFIASSGNPNLRVGEIRELDHYFEATITTRDNSLVDKLMIDKKGGAVRSIYWNSGR